MSAKRHVYFVSDRTGITAEVLGRTLLGQFPNIEFEKHTLPFIDTVARAREVVAQINDAARPNGERPIVLTTLIDDDVRKTVAAVDALFLDLFEGFIKRLEAELAQESSHALGLTHGRRDELIYQQRMDAVNYTLTHDDGINAQAYNKADLILTGVSRTGKTPTCLYLAMQYGVRAANYPLTPDDFDHLHLPGALPPFREKLFGLTISPERLSRIRHERRPNSRYAAIDTCRHELLAAEKLMRKEKIPVIDTSSKSIEEIAISILHATGLIDRVKL
ncbi:MAG: kinase/pyrophosphorylase [Pseudomonadota bacterium]|nr:MAG: kinase/pyrophosphorylase [Pseudomonadota bacterium]